MAGYRLGVDLGTTWTAAAVVTGGGPPTVVSLSQRAPAIPSVVHIAANGTVLIGDAAERRGLEEPERIAREMKRRIGDPTPILLGGSPWAAELLQARVLRAVVDQVAAEQGGPPDSICVTHPANWGTFKLDLLTQAIRQVGVPAVDLLPEPVAAATWYASGHRLDDGATVAVYDLGGGTFDTAVVRRSGAGFAVLGRPDGVERFGGIDVDAAVLAHVAAELGDAWTALDLSDPEALADAAELRQRCVEAKEALSVDTAAAIPVRLPGVRTTVRLTRDELEAMVRAPLGETIVALRRTIASAGLAPADLAAVLLVGGSSRIPLVAHLVSGELEVPVAVDANPKFAVALGAAASPAPAVAAPVVTAPPVEPPPVEPPPAQPPTPSPVPAGGSGRPGWLVPAGIAAVLAVVLAVVFATRGGDGGGDDEANQTGGSPTTTTAAAAGEGSGGVALDDEDDGVLTIGVLLPGGDFGFVAPAMDAAARLAAEDISDATGEQSVRTVTRTTGDGSDDDTAAAYVELVDDEHADLIIAPPGASAVELVARRAAEDGVAGCVAHEVGLDDLELAGGRFFRTIPSEALAAPAMADALQDDGRQDVVVVAPSDLPYRTLVVQALQAAGIAIVAAPTYETGDFDLDAVVAEIGEAAYDAVVLLGDSGLADAVAHGPEVGLTGPFYGDGIFEEVVVRDVARDSIAGGTDLFTVAVDAVPGFDVADSLASRIAVEMDDPTAYAYAGPYVYDCVMLAATAAAAAGGDSAAAIWETLVETSRGGEPCFGAECLLPASEGRDVDFQGDELDLGTDGEVTSGDYVVQRWPAEGEIQFVRAFHI